MSSEAQKAAQALYESGQWDQAIEACDEILRKRPRDIEALNLRGVVFMRMGNYEEFERCLLRAGSIAPNHPGILLNLGSMQLERSNFTAALQNLQQVTRLAPQCVPAWTNVGTCHFQMAQREKARKAYDRAYRLSPTLTNRMNRDLLLCQVMRSREEILTLRGEFEKAIEELSGLPPIPAPPPYCASVFLLAFHGLNDAPLMRKLAQMYLNVCPEIGWTAPNIKRPKGKRIGFFSVNSWEHSVSRCFASLLVRLQNETDFEIVMISTNNPERAGENNPYKDFNGKFVHIVHDYFRARQAIAEEQLDVLFYQDIGMDNLSYFLAFARLAPIQCVLGGHPVTTGIPNVDYFVSTPRVETGHSAEHYTETLIQISQFPVVYRHPEIPDPMKTRSELGLPVTGAIYLCPMMLQKIHPDFDAAIEGILRRDPDGHVVFIKHYTGRWEEPLQRRFNRTIHPDVLSRVHFVPWLTEYPDFVALNARADVVLDPFHFGIGTTAIATCAIGTPVVTLPGEFMRGRVGLSICNLMETPECVAESVEDYVEKAYAAARNPELRERILNNKHRMFDDTSVVRDFEGMFEWMLGYEPQKQEPPAF